MRVLGIDTSNYTTSAALVDENGFRQERRILSVDKGERGLRQSSALFLHTVNLPEIIRALAPTEKLDAVAYSAYPRDVAGSYMPCFIPRLCRERGLRRILCAVSIISTAREMSMSSS